MNNLSHPASETNFSAEVPSNVTNEKKPGFLRNFKPLNSMVVKSISPESILSTPNKFELKIMLNVFQYLSV